MPEIAEVARVTHFLRLHLLGKRIARVSAPDDANIFGKVGTSGPAFERGLIGKRVVDVGRQGKYFWLLLDSPPHPVLHLGMTGWVHVRGVQTAYTRYAERTKDDGEQQWPPRFWKFHFETEEENCGEEEGGDGQTETKTKVEVAFTDARRFGRVRLVDCPGEEIRRHSPLVENGPDPVVDREEFTEEFLRRRTRGRRVPVKALLLDQATVSGIGNWVGDEVLYQAGLHPEQSCNDLDDADVAALYRAVRYVCDTAVEKLGDSDQFPEHWLFKHRWGKGKKDSATTLPNGEKITFITVGGRTSCVVPSVQKKKTKTKGRAAADVKEEPPSPPSPPPGNGTESRFFEAKTGKQEADQSEPEERPKKKARTLKSKPTVKAEEKEERRATNGTQKSTRGKKAERDLAPPPPEPGRRRSGRLNRVG